LSEWRNLVCGAIFVILPASLTAQDANRAMLHNDGTTRLNGNTAPNSSAIFLHDLIETMSGDTAKIDAGGSTVVVRPETVVQFDGDELVLDHGKLELNTARQMRVRVNCTIMIPVTNQWTRYDVMNVDGKITVVANLNDVKIHHQGSTLRSSRTGEGIDATVRQGEQTTRDERCGAARPIQPVHATGAVLNSTVAKALGIAAVGTAACLGLCWADDPLSPYKP